jgi:ribose 5-phosphate isomerase B
LQISEDFHPRRLLAMKIAFANDHSGFPMRDDVLTVLRDLNIAVIDHGSDSPERIDFPDLARKVCRSIRSKAADRGIMLCGTGIGAAIAANKIPGIRACVCHDVHSAHQGVEHDDMNVLCMGGKIIGAWHAKDIIASFVNAEFSSDEYFLKRTAKLYDMELEAARELKDRV